MYTKYGELGGLKLRFHYLFLNYLFYLLMMRPLHNALKASHLVIVEVPVVFLRKYKSKYLEMTSSSG